MGIYEDIGTEHGKLVEKKNHSYGNAIEKTAEIERIKYPDGVMPDRYEGFICDIFCEIKQCREATNDDLYNEDAISDLIGYAIQWQAINRKKKAAFRLENPTNKIEGIIARNPNIDEPKVFTESELPCNAKIMIVELDDDYLTEDPVAFARYMESCKNAYIKNITDSKDSYPHGTNGQYFVTPNGSTIYRYTDGTYVDFER